MGTRDFMCGGRLISRVFEEFQQPAMQTKIVQPIGGFFHQIKVCQRIGKNDYIQVACRRMRRMEAFLYLAAQNFKAIVSSDVVA